jgi:hypothetical protein
MAKGKQHGNEAGTVTRRLLLFFLSALLLTPAIASPNDPNFSGSWQQSNERSIPQRTGAVTLHIEQHDPDLVVETTILRSSGPPRHAVQRYTTDGRTSISTGADGDEFHTSVVVNGASLIFTIEEHEDGRILHSKETWTLIENGAALQREREPADSGKKQTLIYLRK